MTTGEKIQKYRKSSGMSQEELGQKLLVSRQTISLWEKNQTMPTIDNLIRLREVFGVSTDEILGIENKDITAKILPKETYRFNYPAKELNEIYKSQRGALYKRPVLFMISMALLIAVLIGTSVPENVLGFALGMFFLGAISYAKGICTYKKSWQISANRISELTYEYEIFEYYIKINIYRMNDKVREIKCYFIEIDQTLEFGKWIFLQFAGQFYIIRKDELNESSLFYSYMNKNNEKSVNSIPTKWRIASITLFVASILSLWGALALTAAVSNANGMFIKNMWLFFLFTPVTVASLVLGFVMKRKGYKYKKNIIAGIIMTLLLCLYGSFVFIF